MDANNSEAFEYSSELTRTAFNALSAHIAILDEAGVILETNQAWRDFAAESGSPLGMDFKGVNYLMVCDAAGKHQTDDACKVAQGIRSVIAEEIDEFLFDYPCHSPTARHWYYMRVIRIPGTDPVRTIVSHEDITALKLTEEALNRSREATMVDIIETHLNDIVSPLLQQFANANIILTPQEIQVASLVKDGKTSKEIADILNITEATVNFHRKNLRIKFGLKNKQTNLRSYLISNA
ncbi:MAG: LuxR C-terminal-related transcriptional regulator [Deltaproteobacteria bacterium]